VDVLEEKDIYMKIKDVAEKLMYVKNIFTEENMLSEN